MIINNYLQGHRKTLIHTHKHTVIHVHMEQYTQMYSKYTNSRKYISMHKHRCEKWPRLGHTHTHAHTCTDIPVYCPHVSK